MNYNEFKSKAQKFPVILSKDVISFERNKQAIRNQLERWSKRELLIKLRRGIYMLNQDDRKIYPSRSYIANQLYSPSYVSLEYALNYHGLIPEAVRDLTSVTTKKTLRVTNKVGTFTYQHIKPKAFRGFVAVKDEAALDFFIAEPEKAIVDFVYLNMEKFRGDNDEEVFIESYRFQNFEILKTTKIMKYAEFFDVGKLARICRCLCGLIKKETAK